MLRADRRLTALIQEGVVKKELRRRRYAKLGFQGNWLRLRMRRDSLFSALKIIRLSIIVLWTGAAMLVRMRMSRLVFQVRHKLRFTIYNASSVLVWTRCERDKRRTCSRSLLLQCRGAYRTTYEWQRICPGPRLGVILGYWAVP